MTLGGGGEPNVWGLRNVVSFDKSTTKSIVSLENSNKIQIKPKIEY